MLKNILNLDGAQKLTKNEQKEITGGTVVNPDTCAGKRTGELCTSYGWVCCNRVCVDPNSPGSCLFN